MANALEVRIAILFDLPMIETRGERERTVYPLESACAPDGKIRVAVEIRNPDKKTGYGIVAIDNLESAPVAEPFLAIAEDET